MDPSPFHEKDLDHDAEEFITSWMQEYPLRDPVSLVVHVIQSRDDAQQLVETAVHNYFAYRTKLNRMEFHRLLKQGRVSLVIGLAFLALCLLASELLLRQGASSVSHRATNQSDHRRLGRHVETDANLSL